MFEETIRIASTKEEVSALLLTVLPDLRAFARSLTKERVLADDLVQDAAVRALTSAHLFAQGTNFRAWAFMILRNCFYNHVRLNGRYVGLPDDGYEASAMGNQEQSLEMCEFRRAFWQLSPPHREVLTLIGPAGMSYEDTARVCDCAVGTVKSRVSRARLELQQIMEQGEFSLTRLDSPAIGNTPIDDWLTAFAHPATLLPAMQMS